MSDKGRYLHGLNIILMIASLILAIIIPFELFLIAYAVLGPLHYLTEINWLNENQFYIKKGNQIWILVALTLLVSLPILGSGILRFTGEHSFVDPLFRFLRSIYGSIILICFMSSIALVYSQKIYFKMILIVAVGILFYFFREAEPYQLLALLLPSLIHVYVFTLIFMAYGVIKTKSTMGILEVVSLALIPVIIILLPISPDGYVVTRTTLATFMQTNFELISHALGNLFGYETTENSVLFIFSVAGLKIQMFVAFAYLYHYLNWFSKISLIGWLKSTSSSKIIAMVLLWIASVSLYYYDYRLGLAALFFLSLLHVVLEFPLNIVTIRGVFSFLGNKIYRTNK